MTTFEHNGERRTLKQTSYGYYVVVDERGYPTAQGREQTCLDHIERWRDPLSAPLSFESSDVDPLALDDDPLALPDDDPLAL